MCRFILKYSFFKNDYYDMTPLMKRPKVHVLSFCLVFLKLQRCHFLLSAEVMLLGHLRACSERDWRKQEVPVLFPLPLSFISFSSLLFMAHAKTCTVHRGQTYDEVVTETQTHASGVFIDLTLNSVTFELHCDWLWMSRWWSHWPHVVLCSYTSNLELLVLILLC